MKEKDFRSSGGVKSRPGSSRRPGGSSKSGAGDTSGKKGIPGAGRTERANYPGGISRTTGSGSKPGKPGKPDNTGKPGKAGKPGKPDKARAARADYIEDTGDFTSVSGGITGLEDMPDENPETLEGRNPVLEALKAGRTINKILTAKGDREGSINQIVAMARQNGIIVQEVDRIKLDRLSYTQAHQGVIAFVSPKEYVDPDDILHAAEARGEQPFIVILDEISDPHNLGSILRTADAVGAHGIIIPKRRAVGLTATVSKASAGAVEYVPVARVTNLAQTIEYLKERNIWVVGTDTSGEKSFYESDLTGPIALVIGSEGAGIGRLVKEKCDFIVNIPMTGRITSLNASVAGSIVMYEVMRQRNKQRNR